MGEEVTTTAANLEYLNYIAFHQTTNKTKYKLDNIINQ